MTTSEAAGAARHSRSWIGWGLVGLLAAYTGFVHHGFGTVPETFDLAWYDPRSFMIFWMQANTPVDPLNAPNLMALLIGLPAIGLGIAAAWLTRSSVGRWLTLTLVLATFLFLRSGLGTQAAWRFYQWLFSALILSVAATLAAGILAPMLAASWLRLGRWVRLLVYLPIFALAVGLMRNATGFDTSAPLNLSLWPAVPFFGFQVFDAYLSELFVLAGLALAAFAARRAGPRAWGPAVVGLAVLVLGVVRLGGTGWSPALVVLLASGLGGVALRRTPGEGPHARRRGLGAVAAAGLIALPLFVGQGLAEIDYAVTKRVRAQEIIDALASYYEKKMVYPESLQELVDGGYLEAIPRPAIGFRFLSDPEFDYGSFGDNYLLEFAAPGWVQCQYNPPWADALEATDVEAEDSEEEDVGGTWQCPPPRPPDVF